MVSSSPFYSEAVNSMVVAANMVYREFLKSEEGQGFRGEVSTRVNASWKFGSSFFVREIDPQHGESK